MSITYRKSGDIFAGDWQAIVNPVNCVGTMGAGLALAFKKRFPAMYEAYRVKCLPSTKPWDRIRVGLVWVWDTGNGGWDVWGGPQYVMNLPTKDDWRNPSKLEWIADGLTDLIHHIIDKDIRSIALPALGCGCGDLEFKDVKKLMEEKLQESSIPLTKITVFEPQ